MITLLWAQTPTGVIGINNTLPWNIKAEMQHFVAYTRGKAVLMGRKTWESIPNKPLKGRMNYVVSRQQLDLTAYPDTFLINDVPSFLANWDEKQELVVIGGLHLYNSTISAANRLVISIIKEEYIGDTVMCDIPFQNFKEISSEEFVEFKVITYERI
jgi:dihydrofolate reductase